MNELRPAARAYVSLVIFAGAATFVVFFPRSIPEPATFVFLLLATCVTSAWKVNLPIPLASGSTLSVSYAANLMTLLLLGPRVAVLVAAAGALAQCTINVKQPYPAYRTVFSVTAEILTMAATGLAYQALGGTLGPFDIGPLMKPLVGAIATYFCLNTGLVAIAIGLTTSRSAWRVWREDFLWSAASFMVAGSAGAIAAVVIHRGEQWKAVLLLAPVFLTYRTYRIFVGRIADERRHQARLAIALEETQAARAASEAANAVKDQFLATVSHELRTPLNAILGWSDMLRSGIIPESRRVAASDAVYNNAQRQARLIDELLDMARIMTGKLRLQRALVEPREIVSGALETVQPAADAKRITIHTDLDPEIGPFYVDGARLQQVLWNLLSNAVKFTPEGGAVHVRVLRRGEVGEMIVADSGSGIPRDFLPAVFEPFRQADGSSTRLHDGLGLGLSIVKHVVDAHGGSVVVESAGEGLGAVFTVRLPLASLDRRDPELASPSGHETLARSGRDVLDQAPLERSGLFRQSQFRETLHEAREPQMVVIAGMQPDAAPGLEPRRVDLDPAALGDIEPPETIEREQPIERAP
jgi:signal transduction histidine kinase